MTLDRHLSGHWSEHEIIKPVVKDLAIATGHSACFARFANDSFVLTTKTEMPSSFHFIELYFKHYELHDNGMALALLTYQEPETARYLLDEQIGDGDIEEFVALLQKIQTRRTPYQPRGRGDTDRRPGASGCWPHRQGRRRHCGDQHEFERDGPMSEIGAHCGPGRRSDASITERICHCGRWGKIRRNIELIMG